MPSSVKEFHLIFCKNVLEKHTIGFPILIAVMLEFFKTCTFFDKVWRFKLKSEMITA